MAGWQDAPIVGGTSSWQDAPIVGGAAQEQSAPQLEVVATTESGGQVLRGPNGELAYKDEGYATSDPAKIKEIMGGAIPAEIMQRDIDQQRIAANPIASRGMKVVEGVPFVGSWADEAVGLASPQAGQNMRATSEAMGRERPRESAALNVTGAIAGAIPMAMAAGPTLAARAAPTVGARMIQGGLLGAATGAVEGGVYGAGEGQGAERKGNAMEGAAIGGAFGAGLGTAGPMMAEGIKQSLMKLRGSDVAVIQKALGVSPASARVVKRALDVGDMGEAMTALNRAGDDAMLADAGQPARELLDASANAGGAAGKIARDAVDARAAGAAGKMQAALDTYLGKPAGRESIKQGVRDTTKAARSTAYDTAYSKPINYAAGEGRALESLMRRVPKSAIKRANDLMRINGEESAQIIAKVADDGSAAFEVMPDVRQLDYITRALRDVAEEANGKGKLGGTTDLGRGYGNLAGQIRGVLKKAVPEYGKALDTAADAISRTKAADLGYDMLRAATKREVVAQGLRGASKAEREAAKQGLRSYIDDTLANVSRTLTDPNVDAREGIKLVKDMSSRANAAKMQNLLGKKAARALGDELDQQAVAFELRAAIATNSKTAIRQGIQGSVSEQTGPGVLETLASGKPIDASKRFIQVFTGNTDEAKAIREMGIYEEIAKALTQTRGAKARAALKLVDKAMSGQTLSEQQAAFIGNVVGTSSVLAGGREASRRLSTQ